MKNFYWNQPVAIYSWWVPPIKAIALFSMRRYRPTRGLISSHEILSCSMLEFREIPIKSCLGVSFTKFQWRAVVRIENYHLKVAIDSQNKMDFLIQRSFIL